MKLVRPENEPIRRPVQLDRLREQLGVQFLPEEISLEPVRPVVPVPTQVVGSKARIKRWMGSTLSTTGETFELELGFEDFPFLLLGFELYVSGAQAGSNLTFRAKVKNEFGVDDYVYLVGPIELTGDLTIFMDHEKIYWLSGHIIPAGGVLVPAVRLVSDGVTQATYDVKMGILPVYQ